MTNKSPDNDLAKPKHRSKNSVSLETQVFIAAVAPLVLLVAMLAIVGAMR